MAAFHFIISPPTKKPASKKVEKAVEEIPRLTLAPFNSTPEIQFGEVQVNSKETKKLIIYNPSVTVSFVARFGNIDSEDRIFLNGCDIKSCEIHLEAGQEVEVEIAWGPIHSGYLRKTIRIFDVSKKARSFDVVLRGMAVSASKVKNGNSKKLKENNKVNQLPEKKEGWNSTITLAGNQKKIEAVNPIRRQTYTINGKENLVPDSTQVIRSSAQSSSPIFPKEMSGLNENFSLANFSVQSFPSYDSVDAPMKYSNFKSELELSVNTSEEMNPLNLRRSTALHSAKGDVNLSALDKNNALKFCENLLSDQKNESSMEVNILTPIRNNNFLSDSLGEDISLESKIENITFSLKTSPEVDVFITPQKKNFSLDSLTLSYSSKLGDSPSFISRSTDCLNNIDSSSFKSYKREDLFFISPPQKSLNKRCKKTPEDLFPHRSGSSAISDRKKLLKTSFLSRKRISPSSVLRNRGPRRISAFGENISSVDKVKTRNPLTLKDAVNSHCHINDPFLKQVLYNEDKWVERQEKDIIKWMNSVLVPPFELNEETKDWTVNAAEVWLKGNRFDESSTISSSNKVPPLYSVPQKLCILRKRKNTILTTEPVKSVFQNLSRIIDRKIISVRDDRDLHADEGLKKKLLHLLSCYNPIWLRMGLEAVYDQEIALQPKADVGGLGLFIRKKLLSNILVNKRNVNSQPDHVKKSMLLIFLKLVYFLDQARMQKLIRHNRCLFTFTSDYKSSQDLLSAFCADLIVGRGYVMKHLKGIDYNLQFKQTCVDEYNYRITSLDDLRDGIRLARLFEILFMEPDLCSKLRIPAVDIENKKHNVEIAMKAARSRCTIEGNITAEDIVLANRAGSRMKTLSFLWQIINNYLAPLYERAACKIQKWWRIRRMHCLLKNFVLREKERRAVIIQSAWKGYLVRKRFRSVIIERKIRIIATIAIQRKFRAFLQMRRERTAFKRTVKATVILQRWYRGVSARKKFVELRRAALVLQRRYKALKSAAASRNRFVTLRRSTILLQRRRRAIVVMRCQRNQYLLMKREAIVIQKAYRRMKLFRSERSYFITLRRSVINVQRRFRANRSMKRAKEQFVSLRNAALTIQRKYRSGKAMLQNRNAYLAIRNAAVKIQLRFRATCLMRAERAHFVALKNSAIIMQQKFKAIQLMKTERRRYSLLKGHVITLQRRLRANIEAKKQRCQFLHLKRATIIIQRRFRANQLARAARRHFLALRCCAIVIQRIFRATKAMKVERSDYLRLLQSTIFVQRLFRANQIAKVIRSEFIRQKTAAIFIQRKFRALVAMKRDCRNYLLLKQSAICIQQKFRALKLMNAERIYYTNLLKNVIFVQRRFRANLRAKHECRQYVTLRSAAVTIQRQFRANQVMRVRRNEFLVLKTCVIHLQQKFRANRVGRLQRNHFVRRRQAIIFVQQKFRAIRIAKLIRLEYLHLRTSVIVIQKWYRSLKLMRQERNGYQELKQHVVNIQKAYRGLKLMRKDRREFEKLKVAVITIQRRYRALRLMQKTRSWFSNLKQITCAVQVHFIALRKIKATNIKGVNRKALSSSQITKIGPLRLRKYDAEERNAFHRMLKLRAEFLKLKMTVLIVQTQFKMKLRRHQFLETRIAVVKIQRWWRSIRNHWLAVHEMEKNARLVRNNAASKIQALWRGYSVRKKIVLPGKPSIVNKKDKENPDSKGTLGERYKRAIDNLKNSDMYHIITFALWNLETVTTFSAKLCEGVALEGIVPIIFSLISRGNRSEPSIELYRASFSILINLARYAPTKVILWENMDKDQDIFLILHIMKMTHDKFLKKNDIEVFQNCSTLLWLLCQDARVSRHVANVNTLGFQLQKMLETAKRKCPCTKLPKSKRLRVLPKTESNWYADSETRTFNDNCFALSCIYNGLFNS